MAKQGIGTGSSPNDGTGDTLLAGAEKINSNFDEVYTLCGDGTNLAPGIVTAIAAGSNISISTSFGQVTVTALETTGISSYWNLNSTGINTVGRNVGIGTTTALASLTVVGGGRVSGFLTVTDGLVVNAGSKITGETTLIGGLYATGISTITGRVNITNPTFNATQLNVTGVASITGAGGLNVTNSVDMNGNIDVSGTANLSSGADTSDVKFNGATAAKFVNWDKSENQLAFEDDTYASFGQSGDLKIYHTASSGGYSVISESGTGQLVIGSNIIEFKNQALDSTQALLYAADRIELNYNNSKKIETTPNGAVVTGILTATTLSATGTTGLCTATEYGGPTGGRWQVGASGTDHYTFTGPGLGGTVTNDPILYLARGQTYYFNNTSTGQLRIQIGANGSVSSQWNVGVTNNDADQNVQLQFEVPYSAPNTLYYQATNYNTMGGSIVIYPSI